MNKGIVIKGSLIGVLISIVFGFYTWNIDGIDSRAIASESRVMSYVDTKHESAIAVFNLEITNIKQNQTDMKSILVKINDRLYELKGE